MDTALWIVQILLALAFFMAGIMKVTQPIDKLATRMTYVTSIHPSWLVRVIGALEILAALGLVLPAATGILPILTPLAAIGLILTMIGAMLLHVQRKDPQAMLLINLVLLLLAAFVAYGRIVVVPLA
jgi:uncharacterized membrane protein YphA (DoxX/SURF4 family)